MIDHCIHRKCDSSESLSTMLGQMPHRLQNRVRHSGPQYKHVATKLLLARLELVEQKTELRLKILVFTFKFPPKNKAQ
jgi:hypothetical protein